MVEAVKALLDLARLSSRVVRILGQNPGAYTLSGTNTYLVTAPTSRLATQSPQQQQQPAEPLSRVIQGVLVDTGEGIESYVPLLERALRGNAPLEVDGRAVEIEEEDQSRALTWISDIILTHRHHDHVNGLPSVLALLARLRSEYTSGQTSLSSLTQLSPPRIHKFADAESDPALIERLRSLPSGSYTLYTAADGPSPLWPLRDGDTVSVSSQNGDEVSTLQAIHTPGHTADHICLLSVEERTLFSGDHVLGAGTTVFEDLNAYLGSLERCIRLLDGLEPTSEPTSEGQGRGETTLYPGHGPIVRTGRKVLETYLSHRLEREKQVVDLLGTSPPSSHASPTAADGTAGSLRSTSKEGWTIPSLVSTLYSTYPEHLFPAAARGLFLHLHALSVDHPQAGRRKRVTPDSMPAYAKDEGAGEPGTIRIPNNEKEWGEVMEVRWRLLPEDGNEVGGGGKGERL